MRGLKRVICAGLPALLLLSGCRADFLPYAREIEHIALMRTMGVDAAGDGVAVTVSSGVQSKGPDKGEEPPVVLSRTAGTVSGALLSMQADGASYIFYGHVGQLLLGEALALRDARPALDYVLRDIEMRLDTELYLVRGSAGGLISGASEGTASAADRLDAMEEDAGLLSHATPRTVGMVLADLDVQGAAYAPALALTGGEGARTLDAVGYGILKGGVLAGWTTPAQARGINLLEGEVDADVVELDLPSGDRCAARVVGARTHIAPVFQGNTLTGVSVVCSVDANLAEAPDGLNLEEEGVLAELEEALAGVEGTRARAALELSRGLEADFLGLERRAGLAAPWRWAEIQDQWDLPGLELELIVQANLERGYDVDR